MNCWSNLAYTCSSSISQLLSAAIFGTGAKWHLWVSSSRLTVWLITLCVVFFQGSMCWGDQPVEPWLLTLDLSRCLGLELFSFRAILVCLVFDFGMGCMSLSLLVKVWVLLKLQSIVFFYKVDCPLFLPFLQLFLFHFSFSRDLRLHGGLRTCRLFAFTHVVFGLVFLGGWFSR